MKRVWPMIVSLVAVSLTGCMGLHGLVGGGCGMMGGHGGHGGSSDQRGGHQASSPVVKAICPVCEQILTLSESTPRTTYVGKSYYFDTEEHLKAFVNDPDRFLQGKKDEEKGGGHSH